MGHALTGVAGQLQLEVHDSPDQADIIIDFSSPEGLREILQLALVTDKPLVSGTTGLGEEHFQALHAAAERIPVLWSANMSIGMNLLYSLAAQMAGVLGSQADYEIVEAHHRHKKDAPSGTALELGRHIAAASARRFDDVARLSREGTDCVRRQDEIGFSAIRAADIIGEHTAFAALEGERLELTHRVTDRQIFARGALHAARWLLNRSPGYYNFSQTLAD